MREVALSYHPLSVARSIHRLSSVLFYTFGLSVIIGLALLHANIAVDLLTAILHSLDVPLIGSGMAYAGSSLYLSMRHADAPSSVLAIFIAVPLVLLFAAFVFVNFGMPLA